MAKTTVHLPKNIVVDALNSQLAIIKRKMNKETNMLISELLEKDAAELQAAINTAVEAK